MMAVHWTAFGGAVGKDGSWAWVSTTWAWGTQVLGPPPPQVPSTWGRASLTLCFPYTPESIKNVGFLPMSLRILKNKGNTHEQIYFYTTINELLENTKIAPGLAWPGYTYENLALEAPRPVWSQCVMTAVRRKVCFRVGAQLGQSDPGGAKAWNERPAQEKCY